MNLQWKRHTLELRKPFKISKGSFHSREMLIIALSEGEITGLGELTFIEYYNIDQEETLRQLEQIKQEVREWKLQHPVDHYKKWQELTGENRFLRSALDCATYDLYGKAENLATRDLLFDEVNEIDCPPTSLTIGIGTNDEMADIVSENDFPAYKVKLDGQDDQQKIEAIRRQTQKPLRIDANEGWTVEQLLSFSQVNIQNGIEFIEQPIPDKEIDSLEQLKPMLPLPVFADESCQSEEDISRCAAAFDGINIKLLKCGGITPAVEMIRKGKSFGLLTMIGCMTESSIGISAAAQLLPAVDFADLDGALLIANDPAQGVTFDRGYVRFGSIPGNGAKLSIGV